MLSSSILLWWWSLTRQLLPAEQSHLEEQLPSSWLSYRSTMELFIDWASGTPETKRHDTVKEVVPHCSPFGDGPVRAPDFCSLLETLALLRQIKPAILRVPLLH